MLVGRGFGRLKRTFLLLDRARPPQLDTAYKAALSALLALSRPSGPRLRGGSCLNLRASFTLSSSLLCIELLSAEGIQLVVRLLFDFCLLGPGGLHHGVEELDFIIVQTPELVPQSILFLKFLLFRGSTSLTRQLKGHLLRTKTTRSGIVTFVGLQRLVQTLATLLLAGSRLLLGLLPRCFDLLLRFQPRLIAFGRLITRARRDEARHPRAV